jgi:hypothetical protein
MIRKGEMHGVGKGDVIEQVACIVARFGKVASAEQKESLPACYIRHTCLHYNRRTYSTRFL